MNIQKLQHFCNTFSSDDGPKLGRKYLVINELWKVIVEYHKINMAIRKD